MVEENDEREEQALTKSFEVDPVLKDSWLSEWHLNLYGSTRHDDGRSMPKQIDELPDPVLGIWSR